MAIACKIELSRVKLTAKQRSIHDFLLRKPWISITGHCSTSVHLSVASDRESVFLVTVVTTRSTKNRARALIMSANWPALISCAGSFLGYACGVGTRVSGLHSCRFHVWPSRPRRTSPSDMSGPLTGSSPQKNWLYVSFDLNLINEIQSKAH